jgi:hypothetical protein
VRAVVLVVTYGNMLQDIRCYESGSRSPLRLARPNLMPHHPN